MKLSKHQDSQPNRVYSAIPDHLRSVPRLAYKIHSPSLNWQEFKEGLSKAMSLKYGRLANLFQFDAFDVEVLPVQPDDLDSAAGRLYLEEIKSISRRREDAELKKQIMFSELITVIPRPLLDKLSAVVDFREEVLRKQDVSALWTRLSTEACSGNESLKSQYQHDLSSRFMSMKQLDGEPLSSFKLRIENTIAIFPSVKLEVPSAAMVVQTFLKGASDRVYGEAKANLRSLVADGLRPNPQSLSEAYELLESRVTEYNSQYRRQQGATAFTMQVPHNAKRPQKDTVPSGVNTRNRPREDIPECRICKRKGINGQRHWHRECPHKQEKTFTMYMAKDCTNRCQSEDPGYDFIVRLDTQSDKHIFQNENLLTGVRGCYPVPITGVGGHVVLANRAGSFGNINDVLLCDNLGANILSFALIRDFHDVSYNKKSDEISVKLNDSQLVFVRKGNHYEMNIAANNTFMTGVMSVTELEAQYTKKQVQRFRRVGEIMARLAYPSAQRLLTAVKFGSLSNMDLTSEDVNGYLHVYGNIPFLKGKMTDSKIRPPAFVPINKTPPSPQRLNYDIMFVEGEAIFVSVSEPLGLITVKHLVSRKKEEVRAAIDDLKWLYTSRGFKIVDVLGDFEGAVKALKGHIGEMGIVLQQTAPTAHNPTVERHKSTRSALRCLLRGLYKEQEQQHG